MQKVTIVPVTALAIILLPLGVASSFARAGDKRLAIVYLGQIKPYQSLSDEIADNLRGRLDIQMFELNRKSGGRELAGRLKSFAPDVVVCIGGKAYEVCSRLDIAPVILAYNTELINEQDPFCILRYLQPAAKKIIAVVDRNLDRQRRELLTALAKRYGFSLSINKTGFCSQDELLRGDAVFLSGGVLIINSGRNRASGNGSFVVVTDRNCSTYRQLEQQCLSGLAKADEIIDLGNYTESMLRARLQKTKPAVIICIGAGAYQRCRFMGNKCTVSVALRTKSTDDMGHWGSLSGVNMFIEPAEQTRILSLLVDKPLKLALPYNPENTELFVLKSLLSINNGIELIPLPVCSAKDVGWILEKALREYDGVWVIPDRTVSVGPVRKMLLKESLRRKKLLVSMMHPYSKAGAAVAVSSTAKDNSVLRDKVVELIKAVLNRPTAAGKIVSSPVYISLNIRTLKKLNYKVPESLLSRAEYVFGKD